MDNHILYIQRCTILTLRNSIFSPSSLFFLICISYRNMRMKQDNSGWIAFKYTRIYRRCGRNCEIRNMNLSANFCLGCKQLPNIIIINVIFYVLLCCYIGLTSKKKFFLQHRFGAFWSISLCMRIFCVFFSP